MKYRIRNYGERCRIVEDDPQKFEIDRPLVSNLENNELRVQFLITDGCPKRAACVCLDGWGYSSICSHKRAFPAPGTMGVLVCGSAKGNDLKAVLKAAGCPLNRSDCLPCEMFINHEIPSCGEIGPLEKSHALVRCGALKIPKME